MTRREVAERLGLTLREVEWAEESAIKKLRKQWKENGPVEVDSYLFFCHQLQVRGDWEDDECLNNP